MELSNPLFSIILFLSIVAITIIVTNFLGEIKEKNRIKQLKKFIDKFEFLNDNELKSVLKDESSINALFLLAMAFEKEGDYEKSLSIYLAILKSVKKREKFEVLRKVANVYLSAGFLHKARETLLEILKSYPRDKKALRLLLIVDDKLKNYDEMENILEICEELEVEMEELKKEKCYLSFKKEVSKMEIKKIKNIYQKCPCLKRSYYSFLIHFNPDEVFNKITSDEVYEMLDIFYNFDNLPSTNDAFIQIKSAKKELKIEKTSPIFELEVLKFLPKEMADLKFEYICENCKQVYPIYEERCPNCKELFTFKVIPVLEKKVKYRESYD